MPLSPACVQGIFAQFAIKAGAGDVDFSTGATRMPFYRESLQCQNTIGIPDVIYGSRTEPSELARLGPNLVGGQIIVPLTPLELDLYLPLILGANESANVFALAETVPTFAVLMNKVSEIYKYTDGVIDKAMITATQAGPGQPPNFATMVLDCLFKAEDDEAVASEVLSLGLTAGNIAYTFEDCVFTLDGEVRGPKGFGIMIDNHIDQRFINSLSAVTNCPTRRTVGVTFRWPADSDHIALRKVATAGIAGSIVATNGSLSTTFAFAKLQSPRKTPFVTGKTEIGFTTNFIARGLSTTKELIVTNVST